MSTATAEPLDSLDVQTESALEKLARAWNTSRHEVIRRLVRDAEEKLPPPTAPAPPVDDIDFDSLKPVSEDAARRLAALRQLQTLMANRNVDFEEWKREIQRAR